MTANQHLPARRISLALPFIVAISLTFFLFYIDEGYYSFKWMLSLGNWVVFFIYVSLLLGGQLLIRLPAQYLLPDRYKYKQVWVSTSGLLLGAALVYWVFW